MHSSTRTRRRFRGGRDEAPAPFGPHCGPKAKAMAPSKSLPPPARCSVRSRLAMALRPRSSYSQELQRAMREIVFLDIRPAMMRDHRPENGGNLGVWGENISPVLCALPRERLSDVVDWLKKLCGPQITGIEFDRTQSGEVMMMLVEGADRRFPRAVCRTGRCVSLASWSPFSRRRRVPCWCSRSLTSGFIRHAFRC